MNVLWSRATRRDTMVESRDSRRAINTTRPVVMKATDAVNTTTYSTCVVLPLCEAASGRSVIDLKLATSLGKGTEKNVCRNRTN